MQQYVLILALSGALASCGSKHSGETTPENSQVVDKAVLTQFADGVVIPTYQELSKRAGALKIAVTALQGDHSEAKLTDARQAWIATREPWEQGEGFLFGPVDFNGYDPAIDSWPLNKTDLDQVLNAGAHLDATTVAALPGNQKGFHTVEFLLYGESSTKPVAALSAREIEYLSASSQALRDVAEALVKSWKDDVGGKEPYRQLFITAGESGNSTFPSLTAAAEEIVQGMIGICEEVADGKIAAPFDAGDPNLVESQFSYNSLEDFSDNLRSVENAYRGAAGAAVAPAGTSLADRVAARDPDLDARIKKELADAIAALGAIPPPFPVAIKNPEARPSIENAQEAVRKIRTTLLEELLPLVTQ